jgi:hypothetical protein
MEVDVTDRRGLGVHAEIGLSFAHHRTSTGGVSTIARNTWGTTSGVGVTFYP